MPTSGKREARPGETRTQRADRHLSELLQELRVALPGAQVLFAFLLTVPFAARFGELDDAGRYVYFGVLLCTAITVAFIALIFVVIWFVEPIRRRSQLGSRHRKVSR